MVGGEHSLNISALTVWDSQCLEDSERKDDSINESVTKVFIEQPRLHGTQFKIMVTMIITAKIGHILT